jgi:hypothetical protein
MVIRFWVLGSAFQVEKLTDIAYLRNSVLTMLTKPFHPMGCVEYSEY